MNHAIVAPGTPGPWKPNPQAISTCCTFFLEGQWYGVPVQCVREVLHHQEKTPVPLAAPEILGLINLRGQIVTVIDVRRRLQLPARPSWTYVIVEHQGELIGFPVDTVGDVRTLPVETFEPPPETLRGSGREFIAGTFKTAEQLLTVLHLVELANLHTPWK